MPPGALTPLQLQATRLFFSLPQSAGFAVAGGAALIAQGLIQRPTRDVDLFLLDAGTSTVTSAAAAFEAAVDGQGWSHQRVMDQQDFVRLSITGDQESLIIDLGRDSPAGEPVEATDLGPTLSSRDLAARKTLALFGRAAPRDFADVYDLAHRYGRDRLLDWAARDDPGFNKQIFADMLASIDRLTDEDLPVDAKRVSAVRDYFRAWAVELAPP
ncbi:MAG: nucleotidyl transferase AbiEii/AbiGii toxin family protein [Candidatus Babeliaceae bacterium]